MSVRPILLALPILLIAGSASGQVLITEVQSNPSSMAGAQNGEFVEIHNTGVAAVDISGWGLFDFPNASSRRYTFPTSTTLAPGQVIIVTRSATQFASNNPTAPAANFEFLGSGITDDTNIPNMAGSGGNAFALNDGDDGVVLESAPGTVVSGVEFGTTDRAAVPGTPIAAHVAGGSLGRIGVTGSSSVDFAAGTPTPGVGYTPGAPTPPSISMPTRSPANFAFANQVTLGATVVDADGVMTAQIYAAIATSSTGPAAGAYAAQTAVAGASNVYSFTGAVENVGGTFSEPTGFHDRYLRWYVSATDSMNNTATLPANATSAAGSAIYYWENVLPATTVFTIAEARAQSASERLAYDGHSVRVEGVVLSSGQVFVPNTTNFYIASPTGIDAIRIFDDALITQVVAPGDTVRITGRLAAFHGVRQIGRDERGGGPPLAAGSEITVQVLSSGATVPQQTVTVATLLAATESHESQLVEIQGLMMTTGPGGEPIPSNFSSGALAYASDGTGTIAIKVAAITDLNGATPPAGSFTLRGILGQDDRFTGIDNHPVQPRSAADIPGTTPVDGGVTTDSGQPQNDSGQPQNDSGQPQNDSGPRPDAGPPPADSGQPQADGGSTGDAGTRIDTGVFGQDPARDEGCGCGTYGTASGAARTGLLLASLMGLTALRRRRKR